MDNWDFLNDDAKEYYFSKKHIKTRSESNGLSEYLSIRQITILLFTAYSQVPTSGKKSDEYKKWNEDNKNIFDVRRAYRRQLIKGCKEKIIDYEGDINGWTYKCGKENPHQKATKGKIIVKGKNKYHKCKPYCCTIHKNEFKRYLEESKNWPVTNSKLSNWWLSDEERNELKEKTSVKKNKKRKKLIPKERESDDLFELVYEICRSKGIEYLNQLPQKKAWELVISGKFDSSLIKSIDGKTIIMINDGKVVKEDFIEKYRKRFE